MSRRRRADRSWPSLDHEVVHLLRDEPELLAIADAVRATRPRPPAVRRRLVVCGAIVLAILIPLGLLFLPSRSGLVDRALAAVGSQPLIRAELVRVASDDQVINLRSGLSRPTTIRVLAIADERSGLLRARVSHDGVVVSDAASRVGVPAAHGVDELLASFVRDYRSALRRRALTIHKLGHETALRLRRGVEVAVESNGVARIVRTRVEWRVIRLDSTGDRGLLKPKSAPVRVRRGDVVSSRAITASAVTSTLSGAGRVPSVPGIELRTAAAERLRSVTGDGRRVEESGVRLVFAAGGERLVVLEATTPAAAYDFADGRYTFDSNPIPTDAVDVHRLGRAVWLGQMRIGRLFVTIRAATRTELLRVARAMR